MFYRVVLLSFGSIFFGSVTRIENLMDPAKSLPDVVILEMHKVINVDTTGLDAFESLRAALARRGGRLVLVDLNEQPRSLFARAGFLEELGPGGVCQSLEAALAALRDEAGRAPA